MKITLQSLSFLFIGMFVLSACVDENSGKSPEKITEKIATETVALTQDILPTDSIVIEAPSPIPIPIPSPPPPVPRPIPPDPEHYPRPWPPEPMPVPEPMPRPVQGDSIFDIPDVEPVYPGGLGELKKFISENIEYPEIDREIGSQGRVFVEFIVEKDGSLSGIKVLRGVTASLDKEAIRVIRLLPKWKPGEVDGKIVRCRMRFPVTFQLY